MNRLLLAFSALLLLVTINSCGVDDSDKPEPTGDLEITIVNHVDGKDLVLDEMIYKNEAGNDYSVTRWQYYLSNFEFKGEKCGDDTPEASYHLISVIDEPNLGGLFEKTTIIMDVASGCYDRIAFHVGVDDERRKNGPYQGDLSSIWNMAWDWSGDYIFMKFEGDFKEDSGDESRAIYHLAGPELYKRIELDFAEDLVIAGGETTKITIYADIDELFKNPNTIDFNKEAGTMQAGSPLANKLGENYANMFSLAKD